MIKLMLKTLVTKTISDKEQALTTAKTKQIWQKTGTIFDLKAILGSSRTGSSRIKQGPLFHRLEHILSLLSKRLKYSS